jgi:hypothetical protein
MELVISQLTLGCNTSGDVFEMLSMDVMHGWLLRSIFDILEDNHQIWLSC